MKKFRMNSLKNKILIKGIIDIMIPASDDQSLPKASDAINVSKFLSKILQPISERGKKLYLYKV